MGYILNGEYYSGNPDLTKLRSRQQSTYKGWEHDRQRKDNAREIIQPYNRDGTPNEQFIEAWPEESKDYGFLPKDEDLREGQ